MKKTISVLAVIIVCLTFVNAQTPSPYSAPGYGGMWSSKIHKTNVNKEYYKQYAPVTELPKPGSRVVWKVYNDTINKIVYTYSTSIFCHSILSKYDGKTHSIVAAFKPYISKDLMYNAVMDMTIVNNVIYISGIFEELQDGTKIMEVDEKKLFPKVAKLEDGKWSALPDFEEKDNYANQLINYKNELYVCKSNPTKIDDNKNTLVKFLDGKWASCGKTFDKYITCYTIHSGNLLVYQSSNNEIIDVYDGSKWSTISLPQVDQSKVFGIGRMYSIGSKLYVAGGIAKEGEKDENFVLCEYDGKNLKQILEKPKPEKKSSTIINWDYGMFKVFPYNNGILISCFSLMKLDNQTVYAVLYDGTDFQNMTDNIGKDYTVYDGKIYLGK